MVCVKHSLSKLVRSSPFVPWSPVSPTKPRSPWGPVSPRGPWFPVSPRSPFCPFCPMSPVIPFSPTKPFRRTKSYFLQLYSHATVSILTFSPRITSRHEQVDPKTFDLPFSPVIPGTPIKPVTPYMLARLTPFICFSIDGTHLNAFAAFDTFPS